MTYGFDMRWKINGRDAGAAVKDCETMWEAVDWVCKQAEKDGIQWKAHWWQFWRKEDPRLLEQKT